MASYLIWDFDDTLGYRAEGKWTASLVKVLQTEMPDFPLQAEAIRPHMQSGFPWHTPEAAHTHITSADAWWDSLYPLFAKTFRSIGLSADEAGRLARQVRHVYADPSAWGARRTLRPSAVRSALVVTYLVVYNGLWRRRRHVPDRGEPNGAPPGSSPAPDLRELRVAKSRRGCHDGCKSFHEWDSLRMRFFVPTASGLRMTSSGHLTGPSP